MRNKWILLTVLGSVLLQNVGGFGANCGVAFAGTELGNAKFVPYANPLYGISFEYPERWNLVDTGASVSVVATSPGFVSSLQEFADENRERHIGIYFDESQYFSTNVMFEKYVKKLASADPWVATSFLNRFAFESRSATEVRLVLLKDRYTVMHITYPLEENGTASALVQRTVASLRLLSN